MYCASKAGVVNMSRAMALEVAPDVRVDSVCPGYVDPDMIRRDHIDQKADPAAAEQRMIDYAPMKRMATPAEIGQAVLYLASLPETSPMIARHLRPSWSYPASVDS